MNRFVVMVDAGYLLRQSVELLSNKVCTERSALTIPDAKALIAMLLNKSRALLDLTNKELLRVYWYDGVMPSGLTNQQKDIIEVDDVLLRAGTINGRGQQKGVDSLIVTDLIELTTHHAICDAVLVTGDSDLAIGMTIAQNRGIRVGVIGIEDLTVGVAHHQSFEITSRADRVSRLAGPDLRPVFQYAPKAAPAAAPAQPAPRSQSALSAADQATITTAVKVFVTQQKASGAALAASVDKHTKRIDAGIDKALLHHVFMALGRKLVAAESIHARQIFRAEV